MNVPGDFDHVGVSLTLMPSESCQEREAIGVFLRVGPVATTPVLMTLLVGSPTVPSQILES